MAGTATEYQLALVGALARVQSCAGKIRGQRKITPSSASSRNWMKFAGITDGLWLVVLRRGGRRLGLGFRLGGFVGGFAGPGLGDGGGFVRFG